MRTRQEISSAMEEEREWRRGVGIETGESDGEEDLGGFVGCEEGSC